MFFALNIGKCAKYKLSRTLERIWMNKSFSAYLYTIDTDGAGSAVSVTVRSFICVLSKPGAGCQIKMNAKPIIAISLLL